MLKLLVVAVSPECVASPVKKDVPEILSEDAEMEVAVRAATDVEPEAILSDVPEIPANVEDPEILNDVPETDVAVRAVTDVDPLVIVKDVPEIPAKLEAPVIARDVPNKVVAETPANVDDPEMFKDVPMRDVAVTAASELDPLVTARDVHVMEVAAREVKELAPVMVTELPRTEGPFTFKDDAVRAATEVEEGPTLSEMPVIEENAEFPDTINDDNELDPDTLKEDEDTSVSVAAPDKDSEDPVRPPLKTAAPEAVIAPAVNVARLDNPVTTSELAVKADTENVPVTNKDGVDTFFVNNAETAVSVFDTVRFVAFTFAACRELLYTGPVNTESPLTLT